MADGQVVFEISADKTKAYAAIDDVTEALRKAGVKWEQDSKQSTSAIGDQFKATFAAITASGVAKKAAGILLDFGKASIEAASDLQEVQNVVDVTFGDDAGEIEKWAKNARTQYGLTELQAKQFTSTIGAMLKSSGMTGDEITKMSTDLSGLAADMASFYNMDFDTAFQKIRAGISGETEPLKQLGINMSVANLEAYALTQGITKSFDAMSQGEQTMIRYQYLMQATSDAQGDFARTVDTSYANMQRSIQTSMESIKASLGEIFMPAISSAAGALADFLAEITQDKPKTVLDEFAEIKLKTDEKIQDIQATANEARELLEVLKGINNDTGLSTDSNTLKYIRTLTTDIENLGAQTSKQGTITGEISSLAGGLNPTVDNDGQLSGSIGGIIESIGGLDSKLDSNGVPDKLTGFAGKLNPDAEPNIGDTLDSIKTDIDTFAGDLTSNDVPANMGSFVKELNPTVTDTISGTLDDIEGDIDAFGNKLENSGVEASMGVLEGELNPTVKAHIGGTLAGIEEDIDGFSGKLADSGVEAGMAQLEKELNPTIEETTPEKKIGEVEGRIAGLVTTLGENGVEAGMSTLAADMNPTVQDGFKDAVDNLTGSISDLKQAAGDTDTIEQNISDVAGAINELPGDTSKGTAVSAVAEGVNKLNIGQTIVWGAMYATLKNIDGLNNLFGGDAAGNVSALSKALSEDAPAEEKAAAWETFLDALGTNAGALSALTGEGADGAADWLNAVKDALDDAKLDPQNVAAWTELLSVFAEGMSDENKGAFTDAIVEELLALGNQSEYARETLAALGYESDDIADAQGQWLEMCKRLVETIPGLSEIINTQTGEVDGGAEAVRAYIGEWKNAETQMALLSAHQQKRTALESAFSDLPGLMLDAATAKYRMDKAEEEWRKFLAENNISVVGDTGQYRDAEGGIVKGKALEEIAALERAYKKAEDAYNAAQKLVDTRTEAYNASSAEYDEYTQALIALYGETETAAKDAADSMTLFDKAAAGDAESMQTVETAVKSAEEALKSLADYQQNVRDQVDQTVRSVVSGFEKIVTPGQRARNEVIRLTAQLGEASDEAKRAEIQKQLDAAKQTENSMASVTSMTNDLMSQYNYMVDYKKLLDAARAKGVSEDILAMLSDGSQQSYDYLYALANTSGSIDALNRMYDSVKAEAESFTNTLTDQKLSVDDTYQSLVTQAQEAVGGLNLGDAAYANVSETLDAIVKACGDKSASIKTAVDGIVEQLGRLASVGVSIGGWSTWAGAWRNYQPHANGIDYVPYDGYLAMLHQGERVQTAAEADLSRRYSYQQPSLDYNALGGAIGANIQRGNVYLDGRVVGDVLSSRQANSYRAMERSGWQG